MKNKHTYQVVVGNVGTMDYTNKKLAEDCYKTYVAGRSDQDVQETCEQIALLERNIIG